MRTANRWISIVLVLVVGLGLSACGDSSAPVEPGGGDAPISTGGVASRAVCAQVMAGQRLSPDQVARMIEVRGKFFGTANVDPLTGAVRVDRFIATWVNVTGYVVAIQGHVMLWDAFIGDTSGYTPTNDCELSDIRPEFLFVGHGHFDHAQLVPTILNRNRGAMAIGTAELCEDVRLATSTLFAARCLAAVPVGAALGTRNELDDLIHGVEITVLKHPHSDPTAPEDPSNPSIILPVPVVAKGVGQGPCLEQEPGGVPLGTCPPLTSANSVAPSYTQDGKVSVLYQFRFANDFVVTWNNTNGPNPVGGTVLTAMAALPQTDLEFGSILGFNGVTNGFHDASTIAQALRTRLLIPGHHDFLPLVAGETFEPSLRSEFSRIPEASRPGIQFMADPADYVNPSRTVWNPSSTVWAQSSPVDESQGR